MSHLQLRTSTTPCVPPNRVSSETPAFTRYPPPWPKEKLGKAGGASRGPQYEPVPLSSSKQADLRHSSIPHIPPPHDQKNSLGKQPVSHKHPSTSPIPVFLQLSPPQALLHYTTTPPHGQRKSLRKQTMGHPHPCTSPTHSVPPTRPTANNPL